MSLSLRRAGDRDMAQVHALLTEMAAEMGRRIGSDAEALRRHGLGEEARFRAVLAEEAGEACGVILVFPEFSSWRGEVGLFVQDLFVRKAARGRGIAGHLLAGALAETRDWEPSYVSLMVDHRNASAQDWYRRRGFTLRERGDLLVADGAAFGKLQAVRDR